MKGWRPRTRSSTRLGGFHWLRSAHAIVHCVVSCVAVCLFVCGWMGGWVGELFVFVVCFVFGPGKMAIALRVISTFLDCVTAVCHCPSSAWTSSPQRTTPRRTTSPCSARSNPSAQAYGCVAWQSRKNIGGKENFPPFESFQSHKRTSLSKAKLPQNSVVDIQKSKIPHHYFF